MRRFATMLLVVVLVVSLSFPAAALADERSVLDDLFAGQVFTESAEHVWFVAPDGTDGDDVSGSIDDPFASITYAVSKMEGGDTVYVRAGVYREEIAGVPSGAPGKPSTICAYGDEKVLLTGGELVHDWARTEGNGNIWTASMDWDMHDVTEFGEIGSSSGDSWTAQTTRYENLVFVNDELAPEGRWPNATADQLLDRDCYATADRGNDSALVDNDLPDDMDFTGAHLWIASGGGYQTQMATITGYDPAAKRMFIKTDSSSGSWMYAPTGGNYYYVTQSLKTLDSPGEWYKDRDAGKLYLYESDGVDPNDLEVEVQKRAHVVRVGYGKDDAGKVVAEQASYITIRGIDTRLGGVAFSSKTSHCTFEQCAVDAPDHRLSAHAYGTATGIFLDGTENVVTRCEVEHAYGSAVMLNGSRNSVVNNHIHDAGYEHNEESATIRITGESQLVSHNTVHHVMRQALGGYFKASVISYNDLYDCMRVSQDGGVVYFNNYDYENSEFHHNWLHDTHDFPDGQMHVGLYMDSFTTSLVVYRNVVYGIQKSDPTLSRNGKHLTYQINPNSLNNVIVNNTFVNYRPTHLNFYPNHDISGTVFLNNIYQALSFIDGPTYYPWNWYDQWDVRNQKGIGGVKRDILDEMGALFADNMEGKFRNNSWPPIEDQWTDSANRDFTLSPTSSAIDAGRVIAGVTDGYKGSAPDLGAYEYGEARWTAGCDFDVDYVGVIDAERVLSDEIPYRNMLANRSFEDVSNGDFDAWTESGSPRGSAYLGAWGTWGWVVKQGGRYAIFESDGDSLTQRVSNLKPNTTYRVGGYGFVAGEYVRPSAMTNAKTANAEPVDESRLATLRRGNPMSLNGLGELEFDGVDFGSGRDRIVIGLKSPQYFSNEQDRQAISVALGSADNVVGSYTVNKALSTAETGWRWITIDLGGWYEGSQDVFIVLEGSSYSKTSISGFFPDSSISADTLTISANRPNGTQAGKVTVSSLFKPFEGSYYASHSAVVSTDSTGVLDISLSKQGSELVGYADELVLAEIPNGIDVGHAEACSHVFEGGSCDPEWSWTTLDDTDYFDAEHKGVVTLTCEECGERVSVEAPTASEEHGREVVCHASYAVIGDMLEDEQTFSIPFYEVSAEPSEHGAVGVGTSDARRGTSVAVAVTPEDGYDVSELTYERAGKKPVDILSTRSFTMPAANVTLKAAFKPTLASASVTGVGDELFTGAPIEPVPVVMYGSKELEEGVDYTLSYENNVDVGTALVVATGMGDYVGVKQMPFEIVSADAGVDDGGSTGDTDAAGGGSPAEPREGGGEIGDGSSAGSSAGDAATDAGSAGDAEGAFNDTPQGAVDSGGSSQAGAGRSSTGQGDAGGGTPRKTDGGRRGAAAAGSKPGDADRGEPASDGDDEESSADSEEEKDRIQSIDILPMPDSGRAVGSDASDGGMADEESGLGGGLFSELLSGTENYGDVAELSEDATAWLLRYWLIRSCATAAVIVLVVVANAVARRKAAS